MIHPLLVLHTAEPSGAELATLRLAGAMNDMSTEASPVAARVAFTADGPMVDAMRERGVGATVLEGDFDSRAMTIDQQSVLRIAKGLVGLIRLGCELGDEAIAQNSSVIVAQSTKSLVVGAVGARRARVPLVWQVHDRITSDYFGAVLALCIRTLGWLVSDAYIANSRSTMSSLLTWRRPTLVAYPGIESSQLEHRGEQRESDETVIVMAGRLTPWKGQEVFLKALARLPLRPKRAYLVGGTFFDEEGYAESLRQMASDLELPVTFTGHVDDPGKIMRDSDVLVHCSTTPEPFGQVVVEGMSAGCAVIATRPGGPTEIVDDEIDGLLVDPNDDAQLADAMSRLINDKSLRTRLAQAGRAKSARFSIEQTAADVIDFLGALDYRATEKESLWCRIVNSLHRRDRSDR